MGTPSTNGHLAYATATTVRFTPSEAALVCLVAASDAKRLVLTAPLSSHAAGNLPGVGSRAEVSWGADEGLRMLPVELLGVQQARVPLWHFRTLGPVEQVQRRSSVRMTLTAPVQVRHYGQIFVGATLDLSEGGLRCIVTGDSDPTAGDAVDLALFLDDDHNPLRIGATIVRVRRHDPRQVTLVLRFRALSEPDQDQIRTRVFVEQRNRRAVQQDD
jgi:hypothetical protein